MSGVGIAETTVAKAAAAKRMERNETILYYKRMWVWKTGDVEVKRQKRLDVEWGKEEKTNSAWFIYPKARLDIWVILKIVSFLFFFYGRFCELSNMSEWIKASSWN